MTDFLEATIDEFTFRVNPGCLYSPEGIWVRLEGDYISDARSTM